VPNNDILEELVRRVSTLERKLKTVELEREKYSIYNVNTPDQLTANVNDYDIGDYDILFMNSDASRNISGLDGGLMGRRLIIDVFGSNDIVILHNSGLSSAENRISTPTAASVTLSPRHAGYFIYTGAIWDLRFYV